MTSLPILARPGQTLESHLIILRELMWKYDTSYLVKWFESWNLPSSQSFNNDILEIISLCHDFGKYNKYFQQKLHGKLKKEETTLSYHIETSSLFAWLVMDLYLSSLKPTNNEENNNFFAQENLVQFFLFLPAMVISNHHSKLLNFREERFLTIEDNLIRIFEDGILPLFKNFKESYTRIWSPHLQRILGDAIVKLYKNTEDLVYDFVEGIQDFIVEVSEPRC